MSGIYMGPLNAIIETYLELLNTSNYTQLLFQG